MKVKKASVMIPTLLLMSYTQAIANNLQVKITKQSDWNTGFCSNVSIYNPTSTKELWDISFNAEGVITSLWNANYTQDSSTLDVTASGLDWNQYVEPQSSVVFGYCANKVIEETPPSPPSNGDLVVTQTANAQWDGGFCKNVQVKNSSDHEIDWEVNFPINGIVTSSWSSNFSQNPDTLEATASGLDWNNLIQPNAQVEFGYCANELSSTPPPPSDEDIVTKDITNLTFDSIKLANMKESEITSNLNLISSGENGSTISWSSTNSVISSTGVVTRPSYDNGDVTLTLTATVTKGEILKKKDFELKVLANEENATTPPPSVIGNAQYKEVLPLALKFYEAQRATGPFPTVTWRKAGGLDDGSDVGRNLTGGWFDAGDHVKFNLPMSYSATMLNWGMIAFPNGYSQAGQTNYGKEQVKYALDYFIQAYNEGANPNDASDDKVYYQVGDGGADHGFWGPPELMTMDRPTFTCDAINKCSEVAGGMAAAMASGAILFKNDSTYSKLLLDKAKKIYRYAEEYQGNNGYTAANGYYRSYSGYNDELAWGAVWLYKATGDIAYLNKAKTYIANASDAKYWSQNWDNVSNGVNLLLAEITGETTYKNAIETHLNYWQNGIKRTTGGLAFLDQWGSLRYSSTASFMALLYANSLNNSQQKTDYIAFAKSQIDYILGANPRNSSYVVGYGTNPPINPHHRAAHNSQSNNIDSPTNNEFVLEGALVGGPKSADDFDYADDRHDYIANEVATDYNAGFTGALAGMIALSADN